MGQYPVVVFARVTDSDRETLRHLYNRIWCMARPQLLFLACPGELGVYDLARPPVKPNEDLASVTDYSTPPRLLRRYKPNWPAITERRSKQVSYSARNISATAWVVPTALIRDLKTVRHSLMEIEPFAGQEPPSLHHLHSLIGRAIFIRYLEDREILTRDYFKAVASRRRNWAKLLDEPFHGPA